MNALDIATMDLTQQCLRLADDVRVWPVRERGELVYRIEIPGQHRFFRIGYRESYLCSLLDGVRTLPQACSLAAAHLGRDAPTSRETVEIARWLIQNEIAYIADQPPPRRGQRVSERTTARQNAWSRLLGDFNPFWMKLPLPGGGKFITAISRLLSPLLSAPVLIAGFLLIVSALIAISVQCETFQQQTSRIFHPSGWAWMFAIFIALKLIHELAHAVACHRVGCDVHRCGIVLVLFAPLAYVDVTSCWRLPSRWSRIAVSAAGMFVELCIAAACVWLFLISDDPLARDLCYRILFTAGLSTVVFNANVLMRFDGYFILADAVDIPNLAAESTSALKRLSRRWIVGESTQSGGLTGWRGMLVMTYGLASLLWRVSVCVCLAIAASTMFQGAGLVLSVLGIVIWIGTPAIGLQHYLQSLWIFERPRFYRAVIVGSCLGVLSVASVFFVPIPSRVHVPVMTRLATAASVRAPASGFIAAIHVTDGDTVVAGDPLITLVNDELRAALRELEIQSQRIELELRHASGTHNEAQCHVLRRSAESLEKRLADYRHRVESLVVHAAHDGRVIARNLATRVGTYADEGDELMVVAAEEDREWIILIQPHDMEHVQNCVGRNIPVVAANRVRYQSSIQRIQPRATDELIEPAMAAINGGPLATQTVDDPAERSSSRLLTPHFCGYLNLDEDARSLPIGTRMTADCGYHSKTIASHFRSWVRALWEQSQIAIGS